VCQAPHASKEKKTVIQKKGKKIRILLGTIEDQVLYLYKNISRGNYYNCILGKKDKIEQAPCPCTIHAIFAINLSFLTRIPWESFRAHEFLYKYNT
jgi:hypothetical protein